MQKQNSSSPKITLNLKPLLSHKLQSPIKPRELVSESSKKLFFAAKRKELKQDILLPRSFRLNYKTSPPDRRHKSNVEESFKAFLTPREPISIQLQETKFTELTTQNNNIFNSHMKTINHHEKRRLNLTDRPSSLQLYPEIGKSLTSNRTNLNRMTEQSNKRNTFHLEQDPDFQTPFLTQREVKEEECLELNSSINSEQVVMLGKLAFRYFSLKIKNKAAPLKVVLKLGENNGQTRIRGFLSTKCSKPNKFNREGEFENKSFVFAESGKKNVFQATILYFGIYSEEEMPLSIRFLFGGPREETKQIKTKQKKCYEALQNIKELSNEHLKLQIREILQRKRERLMFFSKGINRVELNKTIKRVAPEDIFYKRAAIEEQICAVTERRIEHYKHQIRNKMFMINKHDTIKEFKSQIYQYRASQAQFYCFKRTWLLVLTFLRLNDFFRIKIKESLKKRFLHAFQKQVRRTAIFRTLGRFRQSGENPYLRAINDSKVVMLFNYNAKGKNLREKAKLIVIDVLRQTSVMILLERRLEIYTHNVVKIQKKWKSLKLRKLMYKATIRNFWNKNMTQYFFLIKREKMLEKKGLNPQTEAEKAGTFSPEGNSPLAMGASPANAIQNRRRHDILFTTIDTELQNSIIEAFMLENLKRYRDKMDKYRESLQEMQHDKIKKQKASVLQQFILAFRKEEKPNKKTMFEEFNFLDESVSEKEHLLEDLSLKPPLLFSRPKPDDLKNMMKSYFEAKKLFM